MIPTWQWYENGHCCTTFKKSWARTFLSSRWRGYNSGTSLVERILEPEEKAKVLSAICLDNGVISTSSAKLNADEFETNFDIIQSYKKKVYNEIANTTDENILAQLYSDMASLTKIWRDLHIAFISLKSNLTTRDIQLGIDICSALRNQVDGHLVTCYNAEIHVYNYILKHFTVTTKFSMSSEFMSDLATDLLSLQTTEDDDEDEPNEPGNLQSGFSGWILPQLLAMKTMVGELPLTMKTVDGELLQFSKCWQ